jgi:bis(5'-nucleosyl)-tetraphosphatase (symmetrical)
MSTYVFGDIQGCFREMKGLLEEVDFNSEADNLWFVGDLVNRGPDNLETLRFIMALGESAICVLGNHDLHFLAVAAGRHKSGKHDTIGDLLAAPELGEIIEWMRHKPLMHFDLTRNLVLVHAGIHPQWDIEYAQERADEVERVLRGPHYTHFLKKMYGNKPARWRDDLSGMKRLRVITNCFTRMRYCKKNGRLELNHKANVAPKAYKPWFKHRREKHQGLKIVFGHWASLQGEVGVEGLYALDTGCVWGRELTLLRLDDMQKFSYPALKEYA